MNIIEIESKDNRKIKELNKLKLKKYRDLRGEFIVENWKIIQDAFNSGVCAKEIFLTKIFFEKNKDKLDSFSLLEGSVFLITDNLNKNISLLDTPQGVVAVYQKKQMNLDFSGDIVYLNGISDPGNMGTILRSALAFGLKNIVLDEKCVDLYNSKTIQAAKDAIFKLNIVFDKDAEIFEKIKKSDFGIYVTNVKKGENLRNSLQSTEKRCIVLGSESRGVDVILEKKATKLINIKTTSSIESLNVATSAGIIFYELFENLKESDIDHDK